MNRLEISAEDRWNVEALYSSIEEWNKGFNMWKEGDRWDQIRGLQGKLQEGSSVLLKLLDAFFDLDRHLTKLYTYAHLRQDEDVGHTEHKEIFLKITALEHRFRQETSWISPEFLQLSEKQLQLFLEDPALEPYRFYLKKVIRLKPHTLDGPQEKLLAAAALPLESAERAFGALNNADLKFPKVTDSKGNQHALTHGTYLTYMDSYDRVLRKEAFQTMLGTYGLLENTICELIHGEMQKHLFFAKSRNFNSCLDAALFPQAIDPKVYRQLIASTRKELPILHRYFALRKKAMGLDELHLYDLRVPLIENVEMKFTFDAAVKLIIESVAPLGEPYQQILHQGLVTNRWVDRYENDRKRSGAYSSGCYDTFPYILMNYHGRFNDMKTLSHEAGHSMHSYLSWSHQSYQDSAYPIFLAEVASTFHEELAQIYLLKHTQEPRERIYLLNQKIEDIRNTFIRQVMFAEFELKLHESVEQGIPLTPSYLKQEYLQLNRDYFGQGVVVDQEIEMEWARIPHFYYNFYVYQYATGISAAHALVKKVLETGPYDYLQFLSSGGSRFPLETLKLAGVDMTTPNPVQETFKQLGALIQELERALGDLAG